VHVVVAVNEWDANLFAVTFVFLFSDFVFLARMNCKVREKVRERRE
jgi:hypothetical protein